MGLLTEQPQRIRLSRQRGWRLPDGAVSVARPTKWGNPFGYRQHSGLCRVPAALGDGDSEYEGRISAEGARHDYFHPDGRVTVCHVRYMTRAEIVQCYEWLLLGPMPEAMRLTLGNWRLPFTVDDVRRELAGKSLGCWCPPAEPCHAAVLLDIANGELP